MSWWADYVTVYGPCLTWEFCRCGLSTVCYWKTSKKAGVTTVCQECGDRNYTAGVFATTN